MGHHPAGESGGDDGKLGQVTVVIQKNRLVLREETVVMPEGQ
jgi:hypothetical protein